MNEEILAIYHRNFPFVVREEATVVRLLNNPENRVFERRAEDGSLVGLSVIHKNTILMLCVDRAYRRQGIGENLLRESEQYLKEQGVDSVTVGVGDDYLTPGIPTCEMPYKENLRPGNIDAGVSDEAVKFFQKRGYIHSWGEANCFDMKVDLTKENFPKMSIGDTIDGICYRWAKFSEMKKVIECTDAAMPEFSPYYTSPELYGDGQTRVLAGFADDKVCATLLVSLETEETGTGSVGCTTVTPDYRNRHIGVNIVLLGTKYLKEAGMTKGFLGYTYTGLDKMYGYAGYKISVYYFMAKKELC